MFCKHCGKEIADDSVFCQYCGTNQNVVVTPDTKPEPIKVDVNAKLDAKLAPTINVNTNWIKNLTNTQKWIFSIYSVWFLTHLLLLISGKGERHFFPYIHKGRHYTEAFYERVRTFGSAYLPKEEWMIDWDVDKYGLQEFIVYVALLPLLIFLGYKGYKLYKASK